MERAKGSLASLCEKVQYSTAPALEVSTFEDDSVSCATDDDDSLDEIIEDLRTDTECLNDLDPLYESPVSDWESDEETVSTAVSTRPTLQWTSEQYYIDCIQRRFPHADSDLVRHLALANLSRSLRLQADQETDQYDPESKLGVTPPSNGQSGFHDSGTGNTLSPGSIRDAETVSSFYQGDGGSTRVPPMPESGRHGEPFQCMVCNRAVTIASDLLWKYVCQIIIIQEALLTYRFPQTAYLQRPAAVQLLLFDLSS